MRVRRLWLSANDRNELWRRWREGESLTDIARALERGLAQVHRIVQAEGGIGPGLRRRSRWALTPSEREEISRGIAGGESVRGMARRLRRAPSTISREIRRHGGPRQFPGWTHSHISWAHLAHCNRAK